MIFATVYSGLLSSSSSSCVRGTQWRKFVSVRGGGQERRLPQRVLHTVRSVFRIESLTKALRTFSGSTMTTPRGLTAAPRARSCASSRPGWRSPTGTGASIAAPSPRTRSASSRDAPASARVPSKEVYVKNQKSFL